MQPREKLQIPIEGGVTNRRVEPRDNVTKPDLAALKYRDPKFVATGKLASALGYFSLGLGLAELIAPGSIARLAGIDDDRTAPVRMLGLREIGHGLAILGSNKPTAGVWSRVGGDAVDLAYLGSALTAESTNKTRLAIATAAVVGAGALDYYCARQLSTQDWKNAEGNPDAPTTVGQSSARVSSAGNGGLI